MECELIAVERVIFCPFFSKSSLVARQAYTRIALNAINDLDGRVLQHITMLKKVVNSSLLEKPMDAKSVKALDLDTLVGSSVKISCLVSILEHVVKASGEGLVLVSNYTTSLDLLARVCELVGMSVVGRLDGKTPVAKRQAMIDSFNRGSGARCFLLSSKAGGVGINLIGASKMVMFDCDCIF